MRRIALDVTTGHLLASTDAQLFGAIRHNQFFVSDMSLEWNIQHNLNTNKFIVSVHDTYDNIITDATVAIVDLNNISVTMQTPQTGSVKIIW